MKKPTKPIPILEDQLGLDDFEANALDAIDPENQKKSEPLKQEPTNVDDSIVKDNFSKPPVTDLRVWYKRPKILALIGGAVVLVIGGLLAGMAWRNSQVQLSWKDDQWRIIRQAADHVVDASDHGTYDNFNDAKRALTEMSDKLENTISDSQKQPTFLTSSSNLEIFRTTLSTVKTYIDKAKDQAGDLSRVSSSDLDDLKSLATQAKLKVDAAQTSGPKLSGGLPNGIYLLNERYNTLIDAHKSSQDEKLAKEEAAKSKEDQAKADQANAEEAISRWTQAYIAGSVSEMKKYMTPAFANEYNFTEVTGSYRQYNYPTTYRRVSTDKKSDYFEIVETITFITKSDYTADSNYTNNYTFYVIQDKTSKKWLVNTRNP